MPKLYKRHLQAGRLHKWAVYSRVTPNCDDKTRAKRKEATRKAQRFINCKNQIERLALLIAGNFDSPNAVFLTLTYRPGDLRARKQEVKKDFEKWSRETRAALFAKGKSFRYIRSVEGVSLANDPEAEDPSGIEYEKLPWRDTDKWKLEGINAKKQQGTVKPVRFHVHVIATLHPADYDIARSLWPYGHVYIGKIRVNDDETFPKLASYMTKDTRNGAMANGERCYSCSKGLVKPRITSEWVDYDDVVIPDNAQKVFENESTESKWAYFRRVGYVVRAVERDAYPDHSHSCDSRCSAERATAALHPVKPHRRN